MRKRQVLLIATAILALVLVAALLAGCGTATTKNAGGFPSKQVQTIGVREVAAGEATGGYLDAYPLLTVRRR